MIDTTCTTVMKAHEGPSYVVKYSRDGKYCMSGGQDRCINLWNPISGMNIKKFSNIHNQEIMDIAINQDNSKFSSVGGDRMVFYTDVMSGKTIRRFMGHHYQVNCVSFNNEYNVLITGSFDATVRIWDLVGNNKREIQVLNDFTDSVTSVVVNDDEIITACLDGKIRIYDIRMGQLTTQEISHKPIMSIDGSIDYKYLIASSFGGKITLYDKSIGEIVSDYYGSHICAKYKSIAKFSKSNKHIYTTSEDGSVIVYDILTKSKIADYVGHSKVVSCLDINPAMDGEIITASFDGTVRCWGHVE